MASHLSACFVWRHRWGFLGACPLGVRPKAKGKREGFIVVWLLASFVFPIIVAMQDGSCHRGPWPHPVADYRWDYKCCLAVFPTSYEGEKQASCGNAHTQSVVRRAGLSLAATDRTRIPGWAPDRWGRIRRSDRTRGCPGAAPERETMEGADWEGRDR